MDHQHSFAVSRTLDWNGRNVTFSYIHQRIKGQIEAWLKDTDLREIGRMSEVMPERLTDAKFAEHQEQCRSGHFEYGGEHCNKMLATPAGQMKLLQLLTAESSPPLSHDDFVLLITQRGREVHSIISEMTDVLQGKVKAANGDAAN